jgi:hypothetical protein
MLKEIKKRNNDRRFEIKRRTASGSQVFSNNDVKEIKKRNND